MITSVHTMLYAADPVAARAFFRDVLRFPHVDDGDGWLIFKLPPGELGVHGTDPAVPGGRHEVYLMCDDLAATVAELRGHGVEVGEPSDEGWGRLVTLTVPGLGPLGLYEPRHRTAHDL